MRIALIVWTLLHEPFVQPPHLVDILQRPEGEVSQALDAAAECRIGEQPLIRQHKDAWILSTAAVRVLDASSTRAALPRRRVLTYRRPAEGEEIVRRWFASHDRYTTGDHAALTGLSKQGALKQLTRLENERVIERGDAVGRSAHFVAGARM